MNSTHNLTGGSARQDTFPAADRLGGGQEKQRLPEEAYENRTGSGGGIISESEVEAFLCDLHKEVKEISEDADRPIASISLGRLHLIVGVPGPHYTVNGPTRKALLENLRKWKASLPSKESQIAELEAKLAALKGGEA
ncbi:MAG: hypothetical protein QM627_04825 [Luteolibacter sp.]